MNQSYNTSASESHFTNVLANMQNHVFKVSKVIDSANNLYDINYFNLRLQAIETFDEGEFTIANRIHV